MNNLQVNQKTPSHLIMKFLGAEVRFYPVDGVPMIPVVDIERALKLHRRTLLRILHKNERTFEGLYEAVTASQIGTKKFKNGKTVRYAQSRDTILIDRDGMYGLLFMIADKRIKDPIIQDKVIEFRRWAMNMIGKVLTRKLSPEDFLEVADINRLLWGLPHGMNPEAIEALCQKYNRVPQTIYRWIRKAREEQGLPVARRKRRRDAVSRKDTTPTTPLYKLIQRAEKRGRRVKLASGAPK